MFINLIAVEKILQFDNTCCHLKMSNLAHWNKEMYVLRSGIERQILTQIYCKILAF